MNPEKVEANLNTVNNHEIGTISSITNLDSAASNNVIGNFSTTQIDNAIKEKEAAIKELDKWNANGYEYYYKKKSEGRLKAWTGKTPEEWNKMSDWERFKAIMSGKSLFGAMRASDLSDKQVKADYENAIKKRDEKVKQLEELRSKKLEMLTNLEHNRQKYTEEMKALEKGGITNPFFMLKSGLIGSGSPVSLSSIGQDWRSSKAKEDISFKEFLEILGLIANIGNSTAKTVMSGNFKK